MLIDYTYFFGDLSIGQLSEQSVKDKLAWYINQYEPVYLEDLLGYATYRQFSADILLDPIPARWLDLLFGADYTNLYGRPSRWKGLLRLPAGGSTVIGQEQADIVVGRGRDIYDPAADATTTIIPPGLVGKTFVFVQRGFGPLRTDEFTAVGATLTLLNGSVFSLGDTYFYYGNNSLLTSGSTEVVFKESPIASFIYYWYQRSTVTSTGGVGEGKSDSQNAKAVSNYDKQVSAWNRMVRYNRELIDFLYGSSLIYPEFDTSLFWFDNYWFFKTPEIRNLQNVLTPINSIGF